MASSLFAVRPTGRHSASGSVEHEAGTRFDRALSALLILLSAFPYAGIAVGGDTNIPASSLVAGILVLRCLRHLPVVILAVLVASVPFLSAFLRLFLDPAPLQLAPTVTWVAATLSLSGMAAAVIFLRRRVVFWLSWTLLLSAAFAVIQKHVFIDALNTLPFLGLYTLPGYASVAGFQETFLTYVQRPFGFFPETSFMVGTLSIMAMALLVLLRHHGLKPGLRDWTAIGATVWATAVSGSGSAMFVLAAVMMAILVPTGLRHAWVALLGVPAGLLGAGVVAAGVLRERSQNFNWSWADRGTSILAVFKRLVTDPQAFWAGMGRGRVNQAFVDGDMPIGAFQHYTPIVDIFSVTGRLIAENGVIVGGGLFAAMSLVLLRSGGRVPWPMGALHLFVWIVVSGATISYDNAFWLWGCVGMCLGLELTRQWPEKAGPLRRRLPSPVTRDSGALPPPSSETAMIAPNTARVHRGDEAASPRPERTSSAPAPWEPA